MNLKHLFIISMCIYLFTGCSYKSMEENIDMSDNGINSTFRSASKNKNFGNYDFSSNTTPGKNNLNEELYDFYSQWEGVKYKLGGESKGGIDCSAFIRKAFEEKFALEMPRTTLLQSEVGKEISKNELEVGDLVFFHTGKTKHVGIYIENGKFMHASTKIGVTISDLNNHYFSKNYWKAQRIID